MEIDPKIAMWLNIVAAVLMFTTTASSDLTAIFGDRVAGIIVHASAYFGGLIAAGNAVLHAFSPPIAGPAVK